MTDQEDRLLDEYRTAVDNLRGAVIDISVVFRDRRVRLMTGDFAGRKATITRAYDNDGEIGFGVRIPKIKGIGDLWGPEDTRRLYRPDEFELVDADWLTKAEKQDLKEKCQGEKS